MPLPTDWQVVQAATQPGDQTKPSVEDSLALLQATFPSRYLNLTPSRLRNKMKDRQHTSGDRFPGLRILSRMKNRKVDITAFFFLRLRFCPQAFVMTMGTAILDDQLLYSDLLAIVRTAQTHPRVPRIEVIFEGSLPGDLNETPEAQAVGRTFARGIAANPPTLQADSDIHLGKPWRNPPGLFKRWFAT